MASCPLETMPEIAITHEYRNLIISLSGLRLMDLYPPADRKK
jgi:hypothetical protein